MRIILPLPHLPKACRTNCAAGFYNCIALVGASFPIETLHADMAGMPEQIVPDQVDEATLVQAVQVDAFRCS